MPPPIFTAYGQALLSVCWRLPALVSLRIAPRYFNCFGRYINCDLPSSRRERVGTSSSLLPYLYPSLQIHFYRDYRWESGRAIRWRLSLLPSRRFWSLSSWTKIRSGGFRRALPKHSRTYLHTRQRSFSARPSQTPSSGPSVARDLEGNWLFPIERNGLNPLEMFPWLG